MDWGTDETLGSYIRQPNSNINNNNNENNKKITKYEKINNEKKASNISIFSMSIIKNNKQ